MLARTHAPLSSAIGGTAYAAYTISQQDIPDFWSGGFTQVVSNLVGAAAAFTPSQLATMIVIVTTVGGFALFPDLDEPNSTIVRKTGAVGRAISKTIGPLMGGHRKGTHSFLVGIPLLAIIGALSTLNPITFALLASFAFYLVSSLLFGSSLWGNIAKGILTVALFVIALNASLTPLEGALLAGGGAALHVLEDIMTVGKTYPLWPLDVPVRFGLFKTGKTFENTVLTPLASAYFLVIFVLFVGVPAVSLVLSGI